MLLAGTILTGWVIVTVLVPPIARVCRQRGWLDLPSQRKIHQTPTPRLTGVALFLAIWGTVAVAAIVDPDRMREFTIHALPVGLSALLVLVVGIIDDFRPFGGWPKLGAELLTGIPLWEAGIGFERMWVPFVGGVDLGVWSLPVSILWYLMLLNAINIIDGVDGLAVATTTVATVTLIWIAWSLNLAPIWIASAGLVGGLVAFWRHNRPPAKVFMGDSGSLSLGYFFAVIALLAPIKRFTALAFFVPLIALWLPLTESVFSILRRTASGRSPMTADASHLHHLLLRAGLTPNQLIVAYALVTAFFGGMCVAFRYGNRRVLTVILAFFVLLGGWGLAMFLSRRLSRRDAGHRARPADEV
ncbi:MAG: MraY family glycosyltransferase [Candidatus Zixiibacteriota bacterium]